MRSGCDSWHSQITMYRQSRRLRARCVLRSRARFSSNFGNQNSKRLLGSRASLQRLFGCRCQKQPWTKITFCTFGNAKSGVPGNERLLSVYRYPSDRTIARTFLSGEVSRARTRAMRALRSVGVSVSAIIRFDVSHAILRVSNRAITYMEWQQQATAPGRFQTFPYPIAASQRLTFQVAQKSAPPGRLCGTSGYDSGSD